MTQGLALEGGQSLMQLQAEDRAHKLGPALSPGWPGHSWLMSQHFLGIPVMFGQGEVPEPVGSCGQSALPGAAHGCARTCPCNVGLRVQLPPQCLT